MGPQNGDRYRQVVVSSGLTAYGFVIYASWQPRIEEAASEMYFLERG